MKAKDLMIPLQEFLTPDHTLKEAANLLKIARRGEEKLGVKALPVLGIKGELVGILSIGDVLKAVHPKYLDLMDLGKFTWDGMAVAIAKQMAGGKVRDFMTQMVITVKEDAPIMECIDDMLKHNVKRIPVLNDGNKVIGMLYERDIFNFITDAM